MNNNLSPQESLLLIQNMIEKTKENISYNRVYFLLWGWLTFIGIIGQFFLKVVIGYRHHYFMWLIVFVGMFFIIRFTIKDRSNKVVRTYIGEAMSNLWGGMAIASAVLSFIITFMQVPGSGWLHCYPFFILMYGLGTFVSGKLLQFTPLVVGGIVNWVLACVCVFFSFDYQMLFAAAAILTSYIIPGYLIASRKEVNYAV